MQNLSDNINDNKDLEFIPFETKDNIFNSDANWFPVIRLNTATIDTITNQFITGFSNPITKNTLDREKFNNIITDEEYVTNKVDTNTVEYVSNKGDTNTVEEDYKEEEVKNNKIIKVEGPSEKRKRENTIENKRVNKSNKNSKKSKGKSAEKDRKEEKIVTEPPHMKILREYNLLYLEEESRLETLSLSEDLYREMKEENQEIFDVLKAYEVPQPIIDIIVKKVIRVTLDNCSNE